MSSTGQRGHESDGRQLRGADGRGKKTKSVCWLQMVLCCNDGRVFVSDIARCDLLCELVKPTVDVDALGQPLRPLSFTAADGGRTVFAVGQCMLFVV